MKLLITGFPGTGKSTVAAELQRRGQRAYDVQAMPGLSRIEDRRTGAVIQPPQPLPRGWYDEVGINRWDTGKIIDLLNADGDVFIGGLAGNQQELYDQFDKIFVLCLDDDHLLEQRLRERTTSDFGKDRDSLADILNLRSDFENNILGFGAVRIDVTPSVKEVAATILDNCRELTS